MKRTQNARKGRSQASKPSGRAKTAAHHETVFTCPALAMARLMGTHFRASLKYGELETEARKAGDEDREATFRNGWSACHGVSEVARIALAVAPAESLEGAVAKIIMAWEVEDDLHASKYDEAGKANLEMVRDLLRDDAIGYLCAFHNIDLKDIGVSGYWSKESLPSSRMIKAAKLATVAV